MTEEDLTRDVPAYLLDCPIVMDWCIYKGERYFGMINYERSLKAKRPMIDLCYCATRAFNGHVLKTVRYDKTKFTTNE